MARVRVIGMGDVLRGDEGLGPCVIRVLEAAYRHSDEVVFVDLGAAGADLVPALSGAQKVVVIDVARSEGEPGEIRLYHRDQILAELPRPCPGFCAPVLCEVLRALDRAGSGPTEALLIGVIPARTGPGPGLSSVVRRAVPAVVDTVLEALLRAGVRLQPRLPAGAPGTWWESPPAGSPGAGGGGK